MSKLVEIISTVTIVRPTMILLTETWLDSSIEDGELSIPNYCLHRSDRRVRLHGGVAIYTDSNTTVSSVYHFASDLAERVTVTIQSTNDSFSVCCCYRSGDNGEEHTNALIGWITSHNEDHWICAGDFNLPRVRWDSDSLETGATPVERDFLDFTLANNMTQLISFPTRMVPGQRPATLDIVLLSEQTRGSNPSSLPPLGRADHCGVYWDVVHHNAGAIHLTPAPNGTASRNFFRADYKAINDELSAIKWDDILPPNTSIEEDWAALKLAVQPTIDRHVPKRSHNKRNTPNLPRHVLDEIQLKRKLWRRFSKTRNDSDRTRFQAQRNRVVDVLRSFHKQQLGEVVEDLKKNPKRFFSYLKSKRNTRTTTISLADAQGDTVLESKDVPGEFAKQFHSVFHANSAEVRVQGPIRQTDIPSSQVLAALRALDPNKAGGPDGIPNKFLRECAHTLADPVAKMFSKSFSHGQIPVEWKRANVTPVYKKKGSRLSALNYRPVSLLCCLSKICERFFLELLKEELAELGITDNSQHGFVTGRSCTTNLLSARNKWTKALDEGTPVDIFFADVAKAFDTAEHGILITTLHSRGISLERIRWLESFLYGREQRVVANGDTSDWFPVTSGVPQGSVLGPNLFSLYTSDSLTGINSDGWKFADDVKASNNIKSDDDSRALQSDITTLNEWYERHGLRLHPDKSAIMHLGHNNKKATYDLGGTKLKAVDQVTDLGVILSSNLSVSSQCAAAAAKAKRMAGFLARNLPALTPKAFARTHKALIRPLLEFSGTAWTPWLRRDINLLESAQRLASRLLMRSGLSYEERLKLSKLPTLEQRRERGNLIECFKIIKGHYALQPEEYFQPATTKHLRGNPFKVFQPYARLDVRKNFFSISATSAWNALPKEVCLADSVNQFKTLLDRHTNSP